MLTKNDVISSLNKQVNKQQNRRINFALRRGCTHPYPERRNLARSGHTLWAHTHPYFFMGVWAPTTHGQEYSLKHL